MYKSQIILTCLFFLAGSQRLWTQQVEAPAPTLAAPYPATYGQPAAGQPYLQGAPMIQQGAPAVPIYPPQSTLVPLPSQTPGSIFGPPMILPGAVPTTAAPPGTVVAPQQIVPGSPPVAAGPANPIMVPVAD